MRIGRAAGREVLQRGDEHRRQDRRHAGRAALVLRARLVERLAGAFVADQDRDLALVAREVVVRAPEAAAPAAVAVRPAEAAEGPVPRAEAAVPERVVV